MFTLFTKAATGFGTLIGSLVLMTGTASASCGGLYCANGGTPTLAPTAYGSSTYGQSTGSAYSGYSTMSSMSSGTSYAGSSHSSGAQIVPFSGTPQGLGPNESLTPTQCPVNVYNPEGGDVIGCYSVVKTRPPVQVQNYVRVVRPVIYVRYPVPVQVATCGLNSGYGSSFGYSNRGTASRYGNNYNYSRSYGYGQGGTCGR